jgi:prepilin-type processing-associated H-X9-DG protein
MNHVKGGPSGQPLGVISSGNGTSQVLLIWEHANGPACFVTNAGGVRVPVDAAAKDAPTHYPTWHLGVINVLYCDGHVTAMAREELRTPLFYVR